MPRFTVILIAAASCIAQTPATRTAPPARIVSFTANPESVQSGQAVVLVWATENPNGVTIDPDLGRVAACGSNLQYDVTVEDPNVFTKPWVFPARILPARPEEERVDEFVCENNVDYSKFFSKEDKK